MGWGKREVCTPPGFPSLEMKEAARRSTSLSARWEANGLLIASFAALAVFPLLLSIRHIDDNTLTSWRWVVPGSQSGMVFIFHALGIAGAFLVSRIEMPARKPVYSLLFLSVVLSGLCWSLPEVVIDASRYFAQAKHLELYGVGSFLKEWGVTLEAWTDLPLTPFFYGILFRVFGESRVVVQLYNTALFGATVLLTYGMGKMLWGKETGFLAGLLLLGIPYLFTQVPLMLVDITTMFFFSFALYSALTFLKEGGSRRFLLVLSALGGAYLSKYSVWPFLPVAVSVIVVTAPWGIRKRENLGRSIILLTVVAAVPALIALWKYDVVVQQIHLLMNYQLSALGRWGESYQSTFLFQVHPVLSIFALLSSIVAVRKRDPSYLIAGFLPALMILLQVKRIRYMMVVFPLLAMAAAYGFNAVRGKGLRRFVVYCIVAYSAVLALFFYRPFLQNLSLGNLKKAGAFLNASGAEQVKVFSLDTQGAQINPATAVPILDLYTTGDIRFDYTRQDKVLPEMIRTSPFRFSWVYDNPEYYRVETNPLAEKIPIVVVTGNAAAALPREVMEEARTYRRYRFFKDNGIFRYRTLVTVYLPPEHKAPPARGPGTP